MKHRAAGGSFPGDRVSKRGSGEDFKVAALSFSYCIWAGMSIIYLIFQKIWTWVLGEPYLQG